jgi:hypothetical protein
MECSKCLAVLSVEEMYDHAGKTLCEDCYLDAVAAPKTCDPWAVHSAKNMPKHAANLTSIQQEVLEIIRGQGPIDAVRICTQLQISEEEFRREFATLRHMELARGFKQGERVCYTVFEG